MRKVLFLLFLVLSISCQQDDDFRVPDANQGNQDDISFQENFGSQISADFIGSVVNEQGNSVGGVQITIGNTTTTTDANGIFRMNGVQVFENFAFIKAFRDDYLPGSRSLVPSSSSVNDVQITLLKKNIVGTVSSGSESNVLHNGSKVTFAGDFRYLNGSVYNGEVEVSMHFLSPNERLTFAQMPGSLFGQAQNNDARALETYGMIAIDLFSLDGERLNITDTSPSTLEFPIAPEQFSSAPDIIKLWFFDDEVGYWKEQGTATKLGGKYVGEVRHFSWWNCDLPLDYINACFVLETENGNLANNYVEIIRNETGQAIFGGYTNGEGEECGLFPANEQVTIKVYGELGCQDEIIHQEVIGPFSTDSSFIINISSENLEQTVLYATVTDCNGQPVNNGYVLLYNTLDQNNFSDAVSFPITDGILDYNLVYCDSDSSELIIYDLDSNTNSSSISLNLQPGMTDLGVIQTCDPTGGVFYGDVNIDTQEQLNNFGLQGYSSIIGRLTIGGSGCDVFDLSPLENLVEVSGRFGIYQCDGIQNLDALSGLSNAIELEFYENEGLTDISGLGNSPNELLFLSISGNDALVDLSGLEHLTAIQYLYIQNNDQLVSFNGLNNVSEVSSLGIYGNVNLASIEALNNLSSINRLSVSMFQTNHNWSWSLEQLSNLNNVNYLILSGDVVFSPVFFNFATEMETVQLSRISGITNLESFENLSSVGLLQINNMPDLQSLDGLENLTNVETIRIGITEFGTQTFPNENLTDYCALQNLFINGTYGEVLIIDNAYNPTVQDIIDGNCAQ